MTTAGPDTGLVVALTDLATRVRDGARLLVALDFDGVLAPLVDDPTASRMLPRAAEALGRLAASPGVHLALVSGRGLADLAALATVPDGTHLVGSHGAEPGLRRAGTLVREDVALTPAQRHLHAELADALAALAAGTGARVERKPSTVVLHTRGLAPDLATPLTDAALALGDRPDVDAMRGHDVVELSVLDVTKGDAVVALREATGADLVLFAGDDVTDERAMRRLRPGDLAVRVGDGPTLAPHRVPDPAAMAEALHHLADALEA